MTTQLPPAIRRHYPTLLMFLAQFTIILVLALLGVYALPGRCYCVYASQPDYQHFSTPGFFVSDATCAQRAESKGWGQYCFPGASGYMAELADLASPAYSTWVLLLVILGGIVPVIMLCAVNPGLRRKFYGNLC
ncbi:hypothetical protein BDZ88DRAFT_416911, partial [Geranomyces variabilis]